MERLEALGKPTSYEDRLEYLTSCFERAGKSDFLTGKKVMPGGGVFFATLDFLMTQEKFIKLIEGDYDNREVAA